MRPGSRRWWGLYRRGTRWTLDFAEDEAALKARRWVHAVLSTIERDAVPCVVFDAAGAPRLSDEGGFVLDGVIPHDTDQPEALLRSAKAFTDRKYSATLHG